MSTLIIPCAGRSSRFPGMRPKWMLTHPDGNLMVLKALCGFDLNSFERIIITVVLQHVVDFEADVILKQAFKDWSNVEICVLDDFTSSASETISLTIEKMQIKGSVTIKDSDNYTEFDVSQKAGNYVVGYDIVTHKKVSNIQAKSFLLMTEQGILRDIIEKRVASETICLGVYTFADAQEFQDAYAEMNTLKFEGEKFLSHVISFMIAQHNSVFRAVLATAYEDWGTIDEWRQVQKRHAAYFIDVDGVIMKNSGEFGSVNWENNQEILIDNMEFIKHLQSQGAQIIICTSRTESYRSALEALFSKAGLVPHAIIMGVHHAPRYLINDFAPTNPYPSAVAVSLPRNARLRDWLGQ